MVAPTPPRSSRSPSAGVLQVLARIEPWPQASPVVFRLAASTCSRHAPCTGTTCRSGREVRTMRSSQLFVPLCAMLLLATVASAMPRTVARASPGKTKDACKASAQGALNACKEEARSDKSLAVAKCANLPDASAAKACRGQASADVKDALMSCTDQHDARQAVCARLG